MIEKKIRWRSVKLDGLPKKSGKYLTYTVDPHSGVSILTDYDYSARHRQFNAYDNLSDAPFARDVDFWCTADELTPAEDEVQI